MIKKLLALLLIVALVALVVGCKTQTQEETQTENISTEETVQDIDSELSEIESLEEDINMDELDSIEQDLEEIDW